MMNYFLAGYFLIKPKAIIFGDYIGKLVHTCSGCINDSLLETWCYSWTYPDIDIDEIKQKFRITDDRIAELRIWVDKKFHENKIGWAEVFLDRDTVFAYKTKFFSHLPELKILAIYLNEIDLAILINKFEPQQPNMGEIGIVKMLKKKILEKEAINEEMLGYDFIGLEPGGSFHTFYCYNVTEQLVNKLGLSVNEFGLLEQADNWDQIHLYLNDKTKGLEPVHWVVARTKRIHGG